MWNLKRKTNENKISQRYKEQMSGSLKGGDGSLAK